MSAAAPPPALSSPYLPAIDFLRDTEEVAGSAAEQLSQRWSPQVRMHPRTRFYPISAGDYVAHCAPPHNSWAGIFAEPDLGFNVRLSPDVGAIAEAHARGALVPTVHTIVRRFRDAAETEELRALRGCWLVYYVFLYADQPDARLFGCCSALRGTGHVADLEWVAVLLEPSGESRLWTFYSAHGNRESSWVPSTSHDHSLSPPQVFVALDVQANYPTGGRWDRIWFATADLCASARDPPLSYSLELLDARHPFRRFAGLLGPDGIGAPGRGGGNRFDLPGTATNHIDSSFSRRMFRCS